jgi:lipoyl(octanoyl) transferase
METQFRSLPGLTSYEEARELQLDLVEKRAQDLIPDTVLFLEHEPVITRGRGLQLTGEARARHMPSPVLPAGIAFSESERGGDLTYHGPGQLVMYPIVKLNGQGFGPERDVTGYLRKLEQVVIGECQSHGLSAEARESATGVWVGERKIASIGIAVRRWVTYHGLALNVLNDLAPFHLISPCGYSPDVMTRLSDLVPGILSNTSDWRGWIEGRLMSRIVAS